MHSVKKRRISATKALSATPPAVDKAKEALREGEKLITARQKLVRIADRHGILWLNTRRTSWLMASMMKKKKKKKSL